MVFITIPIHISMCLTLIYQDASATVIPILYPYSQNINTQWSVTRLVTRVLMKTKKLPIKALCALKNRKNTGQFCQMGPIVTIGQFVPIRTKMN